MTIPPANPTSGDERPDGKVAAMLLGTRVAFPELRSAYPLKLLSPHLPGANAAAIVYMLSHGGGLVGGDQIRLDVDVGAGVRLLMLSQGSTKVFKARSSGRASAKVGAETRQHLRAHVAPGALLLLLPDPVTCFAGAIYAQQQTLHLVRGASAVICDWYTSGRAAPPRNERWAFARYASVNEVWIDEECVVRDATVLEQDVDGEGREGGLEAHMGPYGCFANVHLLGPLVVPLYSVLEARFAEERKFPERKPARLLWTVNAIGDARVLRVSGTETEDVRLWLRDALRPLANVVGVDIYSRAFV